MELKNIGINKWQLEKIPGMKVDAVVYVKEEMLDQLQEDQSLTQLAEAAMLPDIVSPVIGMPDIHEGFGLPIGGVMATNGLISCGAVGMDINCGVRLLTSEIFYDPQLFTKDLLRQLILRIEREIPVGVGRKRKTIPQNLSLPEIVKGGAKFIIEKGYGEKEDSERIEEYGYMKEAKFEALTPRAKQRAEKQIGTLGSGNHFIEIQLIEEVFDQNLGSKFNLLKNKICVMLHSGSRALGHQTCVDYTNIFWQARNKYGVNVPTKGLAALPLETKEGQNYFSAMAASVNFAFANRQLMTHFIRQVFQQVLTTHNSQLTTLYDVAHNIAKWEPFDFAQGKPPSFAQGKPAPNTKYQIPNTKLLVHRKGATRALPAGHPLLPEKFKGTGQPAIVPGSMGTPSYVLVGTEKAAETFFSVNHGAGRKMSRREAKRTISQQDFEKQMGEIVYNKPYRTIADEAPGAYKDIEDVVDTLVQAGLTKKVAKLRPLAVIKGD